MSVFKTRIVYLLLLNTFKPRIILPLNNELPDITKIAASEFPGLIPGSEKMFI